MKRHKRFCESANQRIKKLKCNDHGNLKGEKK